MTGVQTCALPICHWTSYFAIIHYTRHIILSSYILSPCSIYYCQITILEFACEESMVDRNVSKKFVKIAAYPYLGFPCKNSIQYVAYKAINIASSPKYWVEPNTSKSKKLSSHKYFIFNPSSIFWFGSYTNLFWAFFIEIFYLQPTTWQVNRKIVNYFPFFFLLRENYTYI